MTMEEDRPERQEGAPPEEQASSEGEAPAEEQASSEGEAPSAEAEAPSEGDAPSESEAPSEGAAPPETEAPNEGAPGHAPAGSEDDAAGGPATEAAATGEAAGAAEEPASEETRAETPSEGDRETPEPAPAARRQPPARAAEEGATEPEVVPGADLEPDLVLDEPARAQGDEYGDAAYAERYAEPEAEGAEVPAAAQEATAGEAPAARTPMDLAADARYQATGKRKTSVARVILRPGSGTYTVNGRTLEQFFPRHGLQATARQPLSAAGYESRMDVVARLHGGGVSSQAGALRHGIARALVEADPSLREDLKRRGYLTRDPRAKERKKAGLKKARKRPQFSKR